MTIRSRPRQHACSRSLPGQGSGNGRLSVAGFTLVELMTVVAIIAAFAAIAAPRYARSLARYRADSAARRIAADLAYARTAARAASASRTVEFKIVPSVYVIAGVVAAGRAPGTYEVPLGQEPYRASIVSADFGGDTKVVFNGFGIPGSGGTVVVRSGVVTKTVTLVDKTGAIEITDGP